MKTYCFVCLDGQARVLAMENAVCAGEAQAAARAGERLEALASAEVVEVWCEDAWVFTLGDIDRVDISANRA